MCISLSFCLVSIRSSWRIRRKSRLMTRAVTHPDVAVGIRHNAEGSFAHRSVQRLDERQHQATLHPVPERPRSQRGRGREPPVVIGDPTDVDAPSQDSLRRTSSRVSGRVDHTPRATTTKSTRRSLNGPDDIPSRNSFDLRTIPMIPQEDSDDIPFTLSPRHSQSPSSSHSRLRSYPDTPARPAVHTVSHP